MRKNISQVISKSWFIDTEQLSKEQISSQVFFEDFESIKNGFPWNCFSKIPLMDFRIATNLETGLSKKCS